MAENTVRIRTTVKDDATKPLEGVRDAWKRLQKDGAQGLTIGAGATLTAKGFDLASTAISKTTEFLVDSISKAKEEEIGIARLGASLKANVPGWNGNTDAIEKNIAAMVRSTGFSDGDMRDSLARLVGSTHDVAKAFTLQQTAMDLARYKGISLADASTALIKVEGGQYRALKELGIVLKDGATQTDALAAVQKVAAGQMAAYMETTAGKSEVLSNRLEDLQETIGGKLLPAVTTGTEAVLGLMDALDADAPVSAEDRFKGLADALNIVNPLMWNSNIIAGQVADAQAKMADEAAAAAAEGAKAWDTGSERIGASFHTIGTAAGGAAKDVKIALDKTVLSAKGARDKLDSIGRDTADVLFDPIILAADHAATRREIAEQRAIIASKNSTKEQVRDAKARLVELTKTSFEQQVELIGWGKLNKKEQAAFLADLKKRWRTATGDAKIQIAELIAAIENIPKSRTVNVTAQMHFVGTGNDSGHAAGGPIMPYGTSLVGERGPEIITVGPAGANVNPSASGWSGAAPAVTVNVNVATPLLTPGGAEALAASIVPHVTKAMQRQQLIGR